MVGNGRRVKINLIAIGKKMPDWIQTGITHYQKQLPRELNFNPLSSSIMSVTAFSCCFKFIVF
jgi:23S rRNA pseudoU1915 N3-methylase RlmH